MSKKVLIFSLAYYPNLIGGAEVAIKEITDRIPQDDISFDMITGYFDSQLPRVERIGNVNIHRVGFGRKSPGINELDKFPLVLNKYFFPLFSCIKATQLNGVKKFDIIWAMMANYAGFGALFFKIFNPKIKYLLTLQEGDPIDYIKKRVGIFYPLFVGIFTKADRVQAISNYLAGFAKDMGYKGEIDVVPNGVDTKKFSKEYPEEELSKLKQKMGKKESDKFIITSSRLVKKNAVSDVIKSLQFLPKNYKFVVLGSGPDLSLLKNISKESRVEERVFFLGQIDHEELPKYLKVSDVFIRPSLSEGMGNSFIEAMSAEIPVVATPVGGIVDFIFDPEVNQNKEPTGLFCRVGDPENISEKILKITGYGNLRKKIIVNAKKLVDNRYDWNKITEEMREVFQKVLQ